MNRKKKKNFSQSDYRDFVAQNLRNAMRRIYPDSHYLGWTPKAIALSKASGVGKSTILRAIGEADKDKAPIGINTDNLVKLAEALDLIPYQLLIPYLNPENPQIAHNPTEQEKALYRQFSKPESNNNN